MKKLVTALATGSVLTLTSLAAFADEVVAPTVNKGDSAWMIVATLLVIMMAVPGLPLFYGGMVRRRTCCRC